EPAKSMGLVGALRRPAYSTNYSAHPTRAKSRAGAVRQVPRPTVSIRGAVVLGRLVRRVDGGGGSGSVCVRMARQTLWFRDQAGSQAHACNALEQGAWALDAFSAAAPGGQWAARATLVRRRFLHETSWGTVADAREAGQAPPRRCSKKSRAGN